MTPTHNDPEIAKQWVRDNPREAADVLYMDGVLVHTSAWDPPDGWEFDQFEHPKDWDRSGVFYNDEDRPEGCTPLYRLVLPEENNDG